MSRLAVERRLVEIADKLGDLQYDMGPIRPPNEGGGHSLLIRATRNCPWRLCAFCYGTPYNREKFERRPVEEVKRDVDCVKDITDLLYEASQLLGLGGAIDMRVARSLISINPALAHSQSFVNAFLWIAHGGRTVFIQDADSLIIKTHELAEIVRYILEVFPQVERITSYARSRTIYSKKLEELKELREAGLRRLHVGLETGDDELLKYVNKGVTAQQHIEAGRKAIEAGLELSLYVMPGLGGKKWWRQHALNTAKVLNEINPHYVRMRTFVPKPGTPLYQEYVEGAFQLLSPHECLREIQLLVENLEIEGRLCFDHFINPCFKGNIPIFRQSYEGYKLPEEKDVILRTIEEALEVDESQHRWIHELVGTPYI